MHDADKLKAICDALGDRYGEAGQEAARLLRKWLSGEVRFANPEIIERHLDEARLPLIFDAFRQVVPFGTGGQRGPVGYGPNRINPANLAITVQGHCNYLRATHGARGELSVVVASDVRVFKDFAGRYAFLGDDHPLIGVSSRSLGRLACEIYAGNGIVAHFPPPDTHQGTMSTPEMAFQMRRLGAVGGIQMSASHNPPDDNGLKIYNEFGSQPIAPEDERLAACMEDVREISMLDFDQGLERGLIRWTTQKTHDEYIEVYTDMYGPMPDPDPALPIVYAPLNGCGLSSVGDLLERLGFKILIPPGEGPDGSFSAVPLRAPNPEVSQATVPAMDFADQMGCGIVLSSDPDVDRVGLDVKLADGHWHHFDGNQIAAVLCRFLMLDPRGPRRKGLVIETFVTTRLLGEIANRANSILIDDLPVGMKYVANVLNELETSGRYGDVELKPADLAFAAEESHGVMLAPYIREKDAAPACMYLACLYQILHREGRTLLDYYVETLAELGAHETVNRSIVMTGADGARDKDTIMLALRQSPPNVLAGAEVRGVVDFWDEEKFGPFKGATDQLSRNSIQFLTDDFIIAIRPSGTEPKLKVYCQLLPPKDMPPVDSKEALEALKSAANRIASLSYNEVLAVIGRRLGDVALLLPDIIDLNQKIRFEREVLPALYELAHADEPTSLDQALEWLQREAAAMVPGADPLPALKRAVAHQCSEWLKQDGVQAPLLRQLANWAEDAIHVGEGAPFVIVSANCGGAARAISLSDASSADRSKALGAYVRQAGAADSTPVVAGLQELSRFDAPSPDRPSYAELLGLPHENGGFYFAPTLSTARYPQKAKWQVRWDENICHAEQGVAACALHGAALLDPEENAPPACGHGTPFAGAVLDLPVVKFRKPSKAKTPDEPWENWIRRKVSIGDAAPYTVEFRHTRYLGDRDTEPRIATAHRVRLGGGSGEFVFINLHLTTLREPAAKSAHAKAKGLARTRRTVSREAEFLRHLQLSEVCDFIWRVYTDEALRLPVIVAGDFNTTPDRPDLKQFTASACLKPVFRHDRCWACGGAPLSEAKLVYSNERHTTVLTEDADAFRDITGETPQRLKAAEYCSDCGRPLFTHKRNFQLVDNILYTNGAPPGAALRARIDFADPEANAGIGVDTHFSDHFPIWSRFRLV